MNIKEISQKMTPTFLIVFFGATMSLMTFSLIGGLDIPPLALFGIPIASLLTCLTMLVFLSKKPLTKRQMILRYIIQHILVQAIVLGTGTLFGWISWYIPLAVMLISLSVIIVHCMVILAEYLNSCRIANRMNEKLHKHFDEEN